VTAHASFGGYRSLPRELRVSEGEVLGVELTLAVLGHSPEEAGDPAALEEATGVVVGMAAVRLMPADSGQALGARTDGSGRFVFCDVPAGSWGLEGWLGEYRGGPERVSVVPDVEILGTRQRTLTREDGGFTFSSLEPGQVRLRVTHLGYGEAEGVLQVAVGEMVEVEVKLATEVIVLDPITVTATRRNLPLWEMQGLQHRIESGWGQFVLRDEIEARSPSRVTDLLVGTGVEVHANGELIRMRRTGCEPLVYLDGQKILHSGPAEALRLVHPADLFAIEIYRGPAETPSQYIDTNSRCGAILLWTHRGR
jgi:hypothetical protein